MKPAAIAPLPLACVAGAIPTTERPAHFELIRELFEKQVEGKTEVPGGYAFRFPAASFDALSRFVSNERRCCPFLAFELAVTPGDGAISLKITGQEGTPDFLDAELCGC